MTDLIETLEAAMSGAERRYSPFEGPSRVWLGVERRIAGDGYRWHGLLRPVAEAEVIFQCTLSGEGRYAEGEREWVIPPGMGFYALVPSDHVYWMPDKGHWTFFWFIIEHPYVVARMRDLVKKRGPIFHYPFDSAVHAASMDLFLASAHGRFANVLDQEQALFDWMFAQERHAELLTNNDAPRTRLLQGVRAATLYRLDRPLSVDELADEYGMSRSHFSHYFRRVTGISPASYMMEIRLSEALRLMGDVSLNIGDIAARTGFADANHFGKVFRKKWGTSPGVFRKQRFRGLR